MINVISRVTPNTTLVAKKKRKALNMLTAAARQGRVRKK
jgi:hypothetical protein